MDTKSQGQKLKDVRMFLKLSQNDFSAKLGITQSYYSALESGNKEIGMKILTSLFELFQVSPDWFFNSIGDIFKIEMGGFDGGIDGGNNPKNSSKSDENPYQNVQSDVQLLETNKEKSNVNDELTLENIFREAEKLKGDVTKAFDKDVILSLYEKKLFHPMNREKFAMAKTIRKKLKAELSIENPEIWQIAKDLKRLTLFKKVLDSLYESYFCDEGIVEFYLKNKKISFDESTHYPKIKKTFIEMFQDILEFKPLLENLVPHTDKFIEDLRKLDLDDEIFDFKFD